MSYFTDAISVSTPNTDYTIFWNRYEDDEQRNTN